MSMKSKGDAHRESASEKPSQANGKAADQAPTPAGNAQAGGGMPLFYKKPRPLDVRVHGKMSLKRDIGFAFAREANAIPLTAAEFPTAASHFPIVFATHPTPAALAVVGLKPTVNLFVDGESRWRAGVYIPAYVRRYPFIFLELNKGDQLALCIDETGGALEPGSERPLFDAGGKQTEAIETALKFCIGYQQNHQATTAFVQALMAQDLLIDRNVNIALSSGENINLTGFRVVDEQRFNALPDATYLEWRKQGWIGLIYAHLLSMSAWTRLGELVAADPGTTLAPALAKAN